MRSLLVLLTSPASEFISSRQIIRQQILMFEYIFTSFLFFAIWFYFQFSIKPRRLIDKYRKQFQARGYKVYTYPFKFMKAPAFMKILQDKKLSLDALTVVKKQYSKHDVVIANIIGNVKVDLLHPNLLREFFSIENVYLNPKVQKIINSFARWDGKGLISTEGDQWKQKRKIFNHLFNFDLLKSLCPKIVEICDFAIGEFERAAKKTQGQNGEIFVENRILNLTSQIFCNVMIESFLGGSIRQKRIQGVSIDKFLTKMIQQIGEQALITPTLIFGKRYLDCGLTPSTKETNRKIKVFRQWGTQFIQKRMEEIRNQADEKSNQSSYGSILEAIALDKTLQEQKFKYDSQTLLSEFLVFLVAGTDTTSYFVEMMIYLIAQHPEVERKIRQEINLYIREDGEQGRNFSYQNLKNFRYLEMVQKQVSRFYGPVIGLFIRQAKKTYLLDGIEIQKGTYMNTLWLANHYNPKYFQNPQVFSPERWEKPLEDPFALGGFSFGVRSCIGKNLVVLESKIAIIKFMKRYSQITLPVEKLKMIVKFFYCAEEFQTKLKIFQNIKSNDL